MGLTCWDVFFMANCDVAVMICFLEPEHTREIKFIINLHNIFHSSDTLMLLSASALAYRTAKLHDHNKSQLTHSKRRSADIFFGV